MTPAGHRKGRAGCVLLLAVLTHACTRPTPHTPRVRVPEAGTVTEALLERERSFRDLRVSMTLRPSGASPAAVLLPSHAYLATAEPDTLRLQVLSPFGVTVFDLTIERERYKLHLPLSAEVRRGRIEPEMLAAPDAPTVERMVIALALLFRPRVSTSTCSYDLPSTVKCPAGPGLVATTSVDAHLRPLRDSYARTDGTLLLTAKYGEYGASGPAALPGRIEIRDETTGTAMIVRVVHSRTGAVETAR